MKDTTKPIAPRRKASRPRVPRTLDALPDVLDFRDRMFEPTLVQVPRRRELERHVALAVPVLDQGQDGACTGFALATVAHTLLRATHGDDRRVSPWMLYRMAQRYDEWPGEDYSGSSARGVMKAWHKHGVCLEALWRGPRKKPDAAVARDAAQRPLGAYLRVNHRDLVAMHAALTEVGVLLATASIHAGWDRAGRDGSVPYRAGTTGAHAFAIVGYDADGFWVQNSWGPRWGLGGFARVTYDDWLANGSDVWVARLGVPIRLAGTVVSSSLGASSVVLRTGEPSFDRLRPHIVSLGNDGALRASGTFGTTLDDVRELVLQDLPRVTRGWTRPRVLLYAHGGLVSERAAIQRTSETLDALLAREVYPISFIWKTDYWTTLTNLLTDALGRRRSEGALDGAKDFMLDRLDDALEPLVRALTGKAQWSEMKENALRATTRASGGARALADLLAASLPAKAELHLCGHSAGAVLLAPLVEYLTADGRIDLGPMRGQRGHAQRISSCTLWAPACTTALFHEAYAPAIRARRIARFALYTLTDAAERDDHCAHIYHKSLLYLVSHALEERARIPLARPHGTPLLGLDRCVQADRELRRLLRLAHVQHVRAPNADTGERGSGATSHGGFDDDQATILGTLERVAPAGAARDTARATPRFRSSPEKRAAVRRALPR